MYKVKKMFILVYIANRRVKKDGYRNGGGYPYKLQREVTKLSATFSLTEL